MGGGPGEFSQLTRFAMHEGRLLVFDFTRIVVFDLDGNYLETIQTGHEIQVVSDVAGSLYARPGSGPHSAVRINARGEIELPIGPECPTDDFFARFQQCGTIQILPHPEHLPLISRREQSSFRQLPYLREGISYELDRDMVASCARPSGPFAQSPTVER